MVFAVKSPKRTELSRRWIEENGNDELAAYVARRVELIAYSDGSYRIAVDDIQWGRVEIPLGVDPSAMADHAHDLAGETLLTLLRNAPRPS